MEGLSVIVCCYNSDWIIERTLDSLFSQVSIDLIKYEIILIDNCSTDQTNRLVRKCFDKYSSYDTSLIYEERPGLMYARETGIREAKYSYLLFCDDDNVLSNNYVISVYDVLLNNPRVAACGGYGIPEFQDGLKPSWFDNYSKSYATGSQVSNRNYLYGAGCCFRKDSLLNLYKLGFCPLLVGRKKNDLLSGDDSELTMALKCLGYTLFPLGDASFLHVLNSKRLNISYLCSMFYGFGKASLVLFMYNRVIEKKKFNYFLFCLIYVFDLFRCFFYKYILFKKKSSKILVSYCLGRLKSYDLFAYSTLYNQYNFLKRNHGIL